LDFTSRVSFLLDQIDTLYPPELVQKRKAHLTNYWSKKPAKGHVPYIVTQFPQPEDATIPDDLNEWERDLLTQLYSIIGHAGWRDDYVPILSNGIIQALVPAYFGCTEEHASMSLRTKEVIKDPKDVYDLPELGFGPETLGGKKLEQMAWQLEMTQGRVAIAETDMQGPFSVASQVWNVQDFLFAIYECPDEVTHMVQRAIKAENEYLHLMDKTIGDNLSSCHCGPCVWMPRSHGVCISEDLLAVVSPDTVSQYINPGLEAVGKEFGGVLVHTCGSMNHSIPRLMEVPHLFGVNCNSSETHIPDMVDAGGTRLLYLTHSGQVTRSDLRQLDPWEQAAQACEVYADRVAGMAMIIPFDTPLDAAQDAGRFEEIMAL